MISSHVPQAHSAAVGVWVAVGSRHEPAALAGASHFLEHMLFKGTRRRSAAEISRAVESRGGYLNAFTQEESTCYHAHVAAEDLPRATDVLCDMVQEPRLAADDIAKERGVVLEEILMYRDQPQHQVEEMLNAALWPGHPLGRPVTGTPETLRGLSRARVREFLRRHYRGSRTVVAFAGGIPHEQCVALTEASAAGLARGGAGRFAPARQGAPQRRVAWEAKDIEQAHLALGFRLFGCRDERRYALRVLNVVLGENMSSRLFQSVRERHGLAYAVHSACQLLQDTGVLTIHAGLDQKRRDPALRLILREVRRLREKPISCRELREAQTFIVGQLRLGLESMTHQMLWLGDNLLGHGRFIPPEEVIRRVRAVTAADVQQLAGAIFRPRRASLAMVAGGLGAGDAAHWRSWLGEI